FFTAPWICALYRRMKRSRLTELLPRLLGRRSMSWSMAVRRRKLVHAQLPFGEQANLLLGVALGHHPRDEVLVLLLVLRGRLGVEGDQRPQILRFREHLLLDHLAQLLVAVPRHVASLVVGARAEHEVDD